MARSEPSHPSTTPDDPNTTMTLAIVGAGLRGQRYAQYAAKTGRCRIAAVADPIDERRDQLAIEHGIPADRCLADWSDLAALGRVADAVVIATPDALHVQPTLAFLDLGYHILLEKPMAPTEPEAQQIVDAARRAQLRARGRLVFGVCHVLRYTRYTGELVDLVRSGRIGQIVSVQHLEPVGWWHQAHSYVRGNWRREDTSGPMLLTKSCHDLDWLIHVVGRPIARVSSFGGLTHLRPESRPVRAADRCLDCPVEPECPYSAPRLYLGCLGDPRREHWPLGAVTPIPTREAVLAALRTGPYGQCVYACDNDVVDHQVVSMEFEGGASGVFTMVAFSASDGHRRTRIFGTHGCLDGDGIRLRVTDFRTGAEEIVDTQASADGTAAGGHGGGDTGLIGAFVAAVLAGDPTLIQTDAVQSLASHQAVWAAERARLTGTVQRVPPSTPHEEEA